MPNFPQDTNDTYMLDGRDIVTTRDYTIEALNGAKINFVGDVRVNDVEVGTGDGGGGGPIPAEYITESELATALADYATDADLVTAVSPLATTAALNSHIAIAATDAELAAAVALLQTKLRTITVYSGAAVTAALVDSGCYLRFSGTNPVYTIPETATVAFPLGTEIHGTSTNTTMSLAAAGVVVINKARTLVTASVRSGWTIIKVNTDAWDLHGDFV